MTRTKEEVCQWLCSHRKNSEFYSPIENSAKYALLMKSFEGAVEIPESIAFKAIHHVNPEGATLLYHGGMRGVTIDIFGVPRSKANSLIMRLQDHIRRNGYKIPERLY